MRSSIAIAAAIAAPLASANLVTATNGGAVIVNQCDWDIPLNNVPAMAADVENAQPTATTLAKSGGTYKTPWVQLLSGGGWSMKLDALNNGNLMQYEYTYQTDGQIWYDMSYVGVSADDQAKFPTWQFKAPGPVPHIKAYTAWNDDANGMQTPVADSAYVTLVLCTGSDSASSAAATYAAPAPTTTEAPPAPTTLQKTTSQTPVSIKQAAAVAVTSQTTTPAPAPVAAPTTTPAPAPPAVASVDDSGAVVVTEFETKIITAVVTQVADQRRKRHAHGHARHGHPQ